MFKYLVAFSVPALGWYSLSGETTISTFTLVLFILIVVPLVELLFGPKEKHNTTAPSNAWYYSLLLHALVPIQYFLLYLFLARISANPTPFEFSGLTSSMGVLCGVLGINVGHELGHRKDNLSKFSAHALLLTSCYLHFHIEHNKGHHRKVATPEDPASAPKGMSIYRFWFRSVIKGYLSAWKIENTRLERKGKPRFSYNNQMVQYTTIHLAFIAMILSFFGWKALIGYILASLTGILLLETVNYLEHYGLRRKEIKPGIYELPQPEHSWSCDFILSRIILFELTMHPAHHKNSSTPYQDLVTYKNTPYLPAGYAGMILLALIPPLWFNIMDSRIPEDQIIEE